ncbi:MAG: extracellular solute-binding protein [Acetobacteraceae bacterium]|nr:extracellular solute-binding protein [Acetobacteraceae bacterium]
MHPLTVSRRTVLGSAALLATPSVSRPACAAGRCVVGTWGGDYARLLRENIDDPILKPQGIEVVQDIGDEAPRFAKLTAQRMLPRGSMDIACLGAPNGYRAGQVGLLEKLNPANAPNLKTITDFLWNDYFVPHIYSAQVIAYNPQTVSDPPKSFGDLLDPKWKGKIGVVATAGFWLMMAAALYASGNPNDFEKAKPLILKLNANGLHLYPETDNLAPAFKSGEIDVGMIWFARTAMWQNAGFPVEGHYPQEGSILYVSGMVVPKNAPDQDTVWKYVDALLEPSAQQGFAEHMGYLPTVRTAHLTGRIAEQLAFPNPRPKLVPPDYAYTTKVQAEMQDWWDKNVQHG